MAVYRDEGEDLGAACVLGCSCLLSCGFIFGLFFIVSGAVLYIISSSYEGGRLFVVHGVIDFNTFSLAVLCLGAVLTSVVLCCITLVKCTQYYIKKSSATPQQAADKSTPLVSRPFNYHYNTRDLHHPPQSPPSAYTERTNNNRIP